ncbi:MAG TPA: YeeE/YedE family protein [Burkholderiales bacterium]|nr:YeeE/YedE family protein [Burkholderiales bacterium]
MQSAASTRLAPQPRALAAAGAFAIALGAVASAQGPRMLALLAIGIALGATLYLSAFGFASAYRRLLEGRGARAVQAQLLMLAAATVLFAPVLSQGPWFGREVAGAVAPAGLQVAVGAFLFGIGMQLAGGCGSGALYTAGGGQMRMAVALATFVAGSFWASLHMDAWSTLPATEPIALGERLGWPAAVAIQLGVLAALYALLGKLPGAGADAPPDRSIGPQRIWRLPWALAAGALVLAALNLLTLVVAGHPWSITWAFALWGAKAARAFGWEPEAGGFWSADFQSNALEASVFADVTSVMDFGLMLGAFAAAGIAGGFRPRFGPSPRAILAAALGGLAMGYGARIAYGCNIGAFFSGVASTSLHGWLWIAAALPGCWVGLRLHRFLAPR